MPQKKRSSMSMVQRTAKIEELMEKVGGRFALTVLIQKRIKELNSQKAAPLVEGDFEYQVDLVLREIEEGKIWLADGGEVRKKSKR